MKLFCAPLIANGPQGTEQLTIKVHILPLTTVNVLKQGCLKAITEWLPTIHMTSLLGFYLT